jgi:hypothetical protein
VIRNLWGRVEKPVFSIYQTSTASTVSATGWIGQKLFLPDAEDVHLLSINTVEYERSI